MSSPVNFEKNGKAPAREKTWTDARKSSIPCSEAAQTLYRNETVLFGERILFLK